MPSPTLEKIRKRFPDLDDVPDNELTVRIGNTYPKLLEKDEVFASEYKDFTEFTIGGAASQVGQKVSMGAPHLLGKIGWGAVEGVTAPVVGDFSLSDLGVFGLVKAAGKFFGKDIDVTGAANQYAKEVGDEADKQLRKVSEGGKVMTLLGEYDIEGTESEMPSTWERRLGNVAQTSATLLPTLAAAPLGLPAVITAAGATTFGSTFPDARRQYEADGDPMANQKALGIATIDGAKTALITFIGGQIAGKLGASDVDNLLVAGASQEFKLGLKEYAKRIGFGAPVEGVEEAIDEGISAAIAQATYNPEADIGEAFGEAFYAGLILGGIGGNVQYTSDFFAARKQARELESSGLPKTAEKVFDAAAKLIQEKQKQDKAEYEGMSYIPEGLGKKPAVPAPAPAVSAPAKPAAPAAKPEPAVAGEYNDKGEAVEYNELTGTLDPVVIPLPEEVDEVPDVGVPSPEVEAKIAEAEAIAASPEAAMVGDLSNDTLDVFADQIVAEEMGLEAVYPADPNRQQLIDNLSEDQKAYLDDALKENREFMAQYGVSEAKKEEWNQNIRNTRARLELGSSVELDTKTETEAVGEESAATSSPVEESPLLAAINRTPPKLSPTTLGEGAVVTVDEARGELLLDGMTEAKAKAALYDLAGKGGMRDDAVKVLFEGTVDLFNRRRGELGLTANASENVKIIQAHKESLTDLSESVKTDAESVSEDVVSQDKSAKRAMLVQKLTDLAQPPSRLKEGFKWREARGGTGNRIRNGSQYTNKPKDLKNKNNTFRQKGDEALAEFRREVEAYAKENDISEDELLMELKQEVVDNAVNTKSSGKGAELQSKRKSAARKFFDLPEGESDIMDDQLAQVGRVVVPVATSGTDKGKVLTGDSKEKAPAEYDGIDRFGNAANELSRRFPKEAKMLLNRVPANEMSGTSEIGVDAAVSALNENNNTEITIDEYWDLMAEALERRLALNESKRTPASEAATATNLTADVTAGGKQSVKHSKGDASVRKVPLWTVEAGDVFLHDGTTYTVEEVSTDVSGSDNDSVVEFTVVLDDGQRRYTDIVTTEDTLFLESYSSNGVALWEAVDAEVVTPAEDTSDTNEQPFAALPAEIFHGVSIPAPTNDSEKNVLDRIKQLIPRIQKRLGGAKVRNIFINRKETLPAFSGARGGDFGSIHINPEVILAMESKGVANLEDILVEEIIHNYNGLAIYHRWNEAGRKGTFTEYYEELMNGVYGEMSVNEIAETVFYYGDQIKGDRVAIAEEYIRIALQRKLTGSINEDLFGRKMDRGGFLSQVMEMLSRFWNGLTRGMMIKSPRIRQLKRRIRRMMKDDRVTFPVIDGAKLTFTPASSGGHVQPDLFNPAAGKGLEGEHSEVKINTREYEETPKKENRFDHSTGDFMESLFRMSYIELQQMDNIFQGKGSTTIPASDAVFMDRQRNTTVPLPEEFYESAYVKIHTELSKREDLDDLQRDQAMWFIYSRVLNDARRFVMKKQRFTESGMKALRDYPVSVKISSTLTDYKRFASGLTKRQINSSDGLVTLDIPVEMEESDAGTMHDLVANPMELSPDLELINDELLRYINDAQISLNGNEKDLLLFGFEENYKHGWVAKFAKQRGVGRSASHQMWTSVQEKMALQLAVKKDLDIQIGKDFPPKLAARVRKVQEAYDLLDNTRQSEREAEEKAAAQLKIKELTAEEVKEPVTPVNIAPKSVEITPDGKVISVASDITHPNIRRILNLPPLARDEKGRLINEPSTKPILEQKKPRKITAASLPPEMLIGVKEKAEQIRAREAAGYRADEEVAADDSLERTDSRRDEIKGRMDAAADNTSDWVDDQKDKFEEVLELLKQLKRQYKYLDPKKHADVIEVLRQFEATPESSQARAVSGLRAIFDGLTTEQRQFFTDILVYRDLQQSIKSGLYQNNKGLPFGFQSAAEVDLMLQEAEASLALTENKKVRDALARRKDILEGLTSDLQRRKLLPDNLTDAENYFHRITLEYRKASKGKGFTEQTDVRTSRKGFQKKRKGSEKDYTTDFLESELEVLSQGYAQVTTHDTLARLDKMINQKSVMKDLAKQANEAALTKVVPFGDLDEFYKPFNTNIAIGISQLQKLLANGSIHIPTRFNAVADSLSDNTRHPDTFLFLKHLMDTNSAGAGYAGMIFKAIRAKDNAIKAALGDDYKTWRDSVKDNDDLVIWQPEEGNFLYKGTVASDAALVKWYEGASKGDTTTISEKDLRKQLVLGGRKSEWVIPAEVAQQLNELTPPAPKHPVSQLAHKFSAGGQAQWKFWKLFNPFGFIKYELNNMTGDADVAFAYDPKIFTYAKQAYNDLYDFHVHKKPLSRDMEDLMKKGVLGSGYMLQDMAEMKPEIAVEAMFEDFTDGLKKKSGWFKKFTNNYTKKVTTFNQVREDTLRLSAYRYFQEKLETGANVYGASNPNELALIPDKKDRAAKMARELLGDYGALSVSGKWLRQHMFPFWSWMEINAPRYVKMMKNAKLEDKPGAAGRMVGVAGKKAATQTAKFALLASTLPFFVNLWNRFFIEAGFADEEDKRVMDARNQQHLLLYSTSEGRVISIKMQGALTDALEWFGAGSFFATATDVALTDETAADAAEQYFTEGEYWKGAVNRLGTSLTPVIKLPAELWTKKQFFPDVTKPSPMRDKTAYFLQNAEMGWTMMGVNALYQLGRDMPSTGVTGAGSPARSLWNFVGYTTDTGESAYNYIRSKAFDFHEEKEGPQAGFTTEGKSDALYYYKKAKKYGDEGAAATWKQNYFDLGGTASGLKRSATTSRPLARVSKHKKAFLRSLTNTEKEILKRAEKWHRETMR